jgi:hypothetical protein
MRIHGTLSLLAAFALVLAACQGDSPTEVGATVRISVNLESTAAPAVLRAGLSFDDQLLNTYQSATGTGDLELSAVVRGVRPGRHTVTVAVLGQTSSPNEYRLGGSVFVGERRIVVREKRGRLSTGESLTTAFDL